MDRTSRHAGSNDFSAFAPAEWHLPRGRIRVPRYGEGSPETPKSEKSSLWNLYPATTEDALSNLELSMSLYEGKLLTRMFAPETQETKRLLLHHPLQIFRQVRNHRIHR